MGEVGGSTGCLVGSVGLTVGCLLGRTVGLSVGSLVGLEVGASVGDLLGRNEGANVGRKVGKNVGFLGVGDCVGLSVTHSLPSHRQKSSLSQEGLQCTSAQLLYSRHPPSRSSWPFTVQPAPSHSTGVCQLS